jgi:two-component system, chemotaxis family, CheB/CheR fusion protein
MMDDMEERVSRQAAAVNAQLVVAVACFAGDVAAPSELVAALPADCGAAFIFVQQRSTGRGTEILLAESLAKRTPLPVVHAHGELMVEHGRLYVISPNATLTMTGARICVTPAASGIDCPADAVFIWLAQEFGNNAIGVILSGGGTDGALGVRAIKHAGGLTFAQYPGSARFPNIPINAIDSGCVDFVLRPNEIAHELARISREKERTSRGALRHAQMAQPGRVPLQSAPATASSLAKWPHRSLG